MSCLLCSRTLGSESIHLHPEAFTLGLPFPPHPVCLQAILEPPPPCPFVCRMTATPHSKLSASGPWTKEPDLWEPVQTGVAGLPRVPSSSLAGFPSILPSQGQGVRSQGCSALSQPASSSPLSRCCCCHENQEKWNAHGEARRSRGSTGHARRPGQVWAAGRTLPHLPGARAGRRGARWRLRPPRRGGASPSAEAAAAARVARAAGWAQLGSAGRQAPRRPQARAAAAASGLERRTRRRPPLSQPGRRQRYPEPRGARRSLDPVEPAEPAEPGRGRCGRRVPRGCRAGRCALARGAASPPRRSPLLPASSTCPAAALRQQKRKMLQLGKVRTLPWSRAAARTPFPGLRNCRWWRVHVREKAVGRRAVRWVACAGLVGPGASFSSAPSSSSPPVGVGPRLPVGRGRQRRQLLGPASPERTAIALGPLSEDSSA